MAYHHLPKITEKQEKFIHSLIDQLGYKDSPFRDFVIDKLNITTATIDYASSLIDKLLKDNKKRKFPQHKYQPQLFSTIEGLAQFSFCPASHSIKETYEMDEKERLVGEVTDSDEENYSQLLEFLSRITEMDDYEEKYFLLHNKEIYDFSNYTLIYNGYSSDEGLFNIAYNIFGKPPLVFKTYSGDSILVLERNVLSPPTVIQTEDLVQATAYINLFPRFNISKVYVIYWDKNSESSTLSRYHKLFMVDDSEKNKKELLYWLDLFDKFNSEKHILFETNKINPEKCYGCICRAVCNHKSGFINDLTLPYVTKEYYQKYPLNYGMDEHQELAQLGIIEAEKYTPVDTWSTFESGYESALIKREHFLLQELIYPFEKEKVGQVSGVELSDIKATTFGDKYIEVEKRRVYIINIRTEYEIYSLTYKLSNGTANFVLFGE